MGQRQQNRELNRNYQASLYLSPSSAWKVIMTEAEERSKHCNANNTVWPQSPQNDHIGWENAQTSNFHFERSSSINNQEAKSNCAKRLVCLVMYTLDANDLFGEVLGERFLGETNAWKLFDDCWTFDVSHHHLLSVDQNYWYISHPQ